MKSKIFILVLGLSFIFLFLPTSHIWAANGDLSIVAVTFDPVQPVVGFSTKIIVTGKYTGSSSLTMNLGVDNVAFSHVDFQPEVSTLSGSSVQPSAANPLISSGTFNFTIIGRFTSVGEKNLIFKIDGVNNLVESNENNNLFNQKINILKAGDLIKLANDSAIYKIGDDGKKHLFVNGPTFWSYYRGNWSALKLDGVTVYVNQISQSAFDAINIGKNIVVKSGARLIKFQNSPKIYTVFSYAKLKLITESRALQLYGSKWRDRLITIQNGFESDYLRSDEGFLDTDDDGLSNEDETNIYFTDPYKADTDGDSYKDGTEVLNDYNPKY